MILSSFCFSPRALGFFSRQILKFKNLVLINMGCLKLNRSKTLHFRGQVKAHEILVKTGYSQCTVVTGVYCLFTPAETSLSASILFWFALCELKPSCPV